MPRRVHGGLAPVFLLRALDAVGSSWRCLWVSSEQIEPPLSSSAAAQLLPPLLPPRLCAEKIGSAWFLVRLPLSKLLPRPLHRRSSVASPASTAVSTSGSPERRSAGGVVPNQLAAFLCSLILPCEQAPPLWAMLHRRSHPSCHVLLPLNPPTAIAVSPPSLAPLLLYLLQQASCFCSKRRSLRRVWGHTTALAG